MSEINYPLLDRTIEYIEKHSEEHQQSVYRCSTGMCVAGHAAVLDGAKWVHPEDPDDPMVFVEQADRDAFPSLLEDGETMVHVSLSASRRLGLSDDQALVLFGGGNALPTIKAIVALLHSNPEADKSELNRVRRRALGLTP
jgi:hypothetical protein